MLDQSTVGSLYRLFFTVNMVFLLLTYKICLLLLSTCLLGIETSLIHEDSSYFLYQHSEYPRDCKEVLHHCSFDNASGVYIVKPDGYSAPFEVYCNNEISSGGWTVIHRQIDGSLTYRRRWEDYKNGFGFISSEYWIGHDKLSYLTNQAVYELRIDITLSNGSFFYVSYNSFRISDEWSDYAIVSAEEFRSNWSCIVSTCPINMLHDGCTCQQMCTDPIGQTDCYTDCVEACVPEGCFVAEKNSFFTFQNGESFINADCTKNCTCINNQLNCKTDYECSTDATCTVRDEIRKCYCNQGYDGDGETCVSVFKDCYEAYEANHTSDGIYTIFPTDWPGSPFEVFCNMTFGDGGWTVLQRRIDGVTDFYRNWTEYKHGFGLLNEGNDFWLGNEQLHYLTDQKDYILRIDFVHSSDRSYYEEFTTFKIGNESSKYRLNYGSFNRGNAGYAIEKCKCNHVLDGVNIAVRAHDLLEQHVEVGHATCYQSLQYNNGKKFSTRDEDNDECSNHDFAKRHKGGWWYSDHWCSYCYYSHCYFFEYGSSGCYTLASYVNLNGDYNGGKGENIFYSMSGSSDCNQKFTEMKIRPSNP